MANRLLVDLKQHHIWCNRHNQPREGCDICEEYYVKYPPSQQMDEQFFPTRHLFDKKPNSKIFRNSAGHDGRLNGNGGRKRRRNNNVGPIVQ